MGGSQRLPTMDDRLRVLEEEYRNNERVKKSIIQGMKEILKKTEDLEQAKTQTVKDIADLQVHIALIDKMMLNFNGAAAASGEPETAAPKSSGVDIWLTQRTAIKVFNERYGFMLPLQKGLANPFLAAGYLEPLPGKNGDRESIRYRITPEGSKLGWLKETSGNISVLDSKLDEVRNVVAAYYRNLYKEI